MISPSSVRARDLEHLRQAGLLDHQRVVAGGLEAGRAARRRRRVRRGGSARSCRASRCGARTTRPPKAWPIAWWPRQTPRMRHAAREARSRPATETPASSGRPGPGEITTPAGRRAAQLADGDRRRCGRTVELRAQLAQVLDEVVGEGVVVVDHEERASVAAPRAPCRSPGSAPRSPSGPSPGTRSRGPSPPRCPPPAWTKTEPPWISMVRIAMRHVHVARVVDVAHAASVGPAPRASRARR